MWLPSSSALVLKFDVVELVDFESVGVKPSNILVVKSKRWPLHLVLWVCVGDEQPDRAGLGLSTKLFNVRRPYIVWKGDHRRPIVPCVGLHGLFPDVEKVPLNHGKWRARVLSMATE